MKNTNIMASTRSTFLNIIANALTVDVTALDPNPVDGHAWPYKYYNETLSFDGIFPLGFKYGSVAVGNQVQLYRYPRNDTVAVCVLTEDSDDSTCDSLGSNASSIAATTYLDPVITSIDQLGALPSGRVVLSDQSLSSSFKKTTSESKVDSSLLTSSDILQSVDVVPVTLSETANTVSFEVGFEPNADVMLSVYWDDVLLTRIDSLDHEGSAIVSSGPVGLPEISDLTGNVTFRIDPAIGDASVTTIGSFRAYNTAELNTRVIEPNIWTELSMPLTGRIGATYRDVLSSLDMDEYQVIWALFEYKSAINDYAIVDINSQFQPLTAVWFLHSESGPITVSVSGVPAVQDTLPTTRCSDDNCLETVLQDTITNVIWVQIGAMDVGAMSLESLKLYAESGGECAEGCSLSEASQIGLASDVIYSYNSDIGDYDRIPVDSSLEAWNGGWLGVRAPQGSEVYRLVYDF